MTDVHDTGHYDAPLQLDRYYELHELIYFQHIHKTRIN